METSHWEWLPVIHFNSHLPIKHLDLSITGHTSLILTSSPCSLFICSTVLKLGHETSRLPQSFRRHCRGNAPPRSFPVAAQPKKKPLRVAFMSDFHIKPGKVQEEGTAKAFHHVQRLDDKVDFIINGGDAIMDALGVVDKAKTESNSICSIRHWNRRKKQFYPFIIASAITIYAVDSSIKENKPETNRAMVKCVGGGKNSICRNAIIVLPKANGISLYLTVRKIIRPAVILQRSMVKEQLEWLKTELQSVSATTHICLVSHIPILSICAGLFFNKTEANGDLKIQAHLMHSDFLTLNSIFLKYP